MALDGKAIKEEIPDKEAYDSGSVRRVKGEFTFVWHFQIVEERKNFYLLMKLACKQDCVDIRLPSLINQLVIDKNFPTNTRHHQFILTRIKIYCEIFFIRLFMSAYGKISWRCFFHTFSVWKNISMTINHILMSQLNTSVIDPS